MRAQLRTGEIVMLDDYYVSYLWLRNNTPADARILAWWDYGYQITGIGNRTSLADGNTWNHEHIATIGKLLTSPVAKAHLLIRHLADYVLIWTGSRAEDLMKSPHMARIGNSVYRDICPGDDPLCSNFGFEDYDLSRPTPIMRMSLLYNLHVSGEHPSPAIDNMFRLALQVAPRPGEDLQGDECERGEQGVGGGPEEPQVRRARVVAVHWAVPASEGDPGDAGEAHRLRPAGGLQTAANETTRTTVRTCVASAMKGVARGLGKCRWSAN
ncbi:putative oligosaccharyl transferase subunit [Trypanosoma cruzi]|uniref:Putative oligosaccharyl transferase subunit n=1 Tax=Trypanosoma cruzi TaxID=5693 RepID=A0A2V2WUP9_TRYCR|nr:putative oligosaccharyl transferase subunit [Trypanosoma cruzi]